MISRSLAILLAILGLYLSAFDAAAQPRHGGWQGGGGFAGAPGRYGGPRGGFRGYGGPGPDDGYGRGFTPPRYGYGGGQPDYGARGYPAGPGYGGPARAFPGRGYGGGAFGGDWRTEQNEVRSAVREGRHIPLGQAIEAVRRRAPGRELDAGLEAGPNGRSVYRLRWAGQDGRRRDYLVDAGSGAVLGVQGGP